MLLDINHELVRVCPGKMATMLEMGGFHEAFATRAFIARPFTACVLIASAYCITGRLWTSRSNRYPDPDFSAFTNLIPDSNSKLDTEPIALPITRTYPRVRYTRRGDRTDQWN